MNNYYSVLSAKTGHAFVYNFKPTKYLSIVGHSNFNEALEYCKKEEDFYKKFNPKFRYDLEGKYE